MCPQHVTLSELGEPTRGQLWYNKGACESRHESGCPSRGCPPLHTLALLTCESDLLMGCLESTAS